MKMAGNHDIEKTNEILIYTGPDGGVKVEVFFQNETLWLTQKRMSDLFGVEVNTVNYHLKEIMESGELDENSVIRKIRITATDGKNYLTNLYNLDAVIAVGYRVNSYQATRFRIWATGVLRDYIIKGFALDDERIKQGKHWGKDYFDELLERIREIRASERRFYQKITDIYAQCSIDYDSNAPITQEFYATVQNKLHWAITKKTAAEIILSRADSGKTHMGLMSWKHAPDDKVLKSDVNIAKNYLNEDELHHLNRVVSMYLDFAENQAEKQIVMTMTDWAKRLDAFLEFNEYEVLKSAGVVSAKVAKELAETEYDKFRIVQDREFASDFDREVKRLHEKNGTGEDE